MSIIRPVFDFTPDGTAYTLSGKTDAPVVVLVHGLGLCQQMWSQHAADFEVNYKLLRYDLMGHGNSIPPNTETTLSLYAQQLRGLLDHLEIVRAAVVGFSIGGMINRRFALDYPDRLSALAILNSPHDRGPEAQALVESRATKVVDEGTMATIDAALERWFTPSFRETNPGYMNLVRSWRQEVDVSSYAEAAWVLATGVKELTRPSIAVRVPSIVITSQNDSGSTPAMCAALAAEITNSEQFVVPNLQHLGLIEQPQAFTTPVIDFFKRVGL